MNHPTESLRPVPVSLISDTMNAMARAYERIHSMPRVSDTELAKKVDEAKERLRPYLTAPASPLPEGGVTSYAAGGLDVLSRIRSRLNEQIERAESDLNSTVAIRLNDAKAIRHLLVPAAPTGDAK